MTGSKEPAQRVTFGPFEVDFRTQELRKQGVRLRIAGQPFQILRMLLEHPGEWVTREELRQAWPSDTFVDFEHAARRLLEICGRTANIEEIRGQYMRLLKFAPSAWTAVETLLGNLDPANGDRLDSTELLRRLLATNELPISTLSTDGQWGEIVIQGT